MMTRIRTLSALLVVAGIAAPPAAMSATPPAVTGATPPAAVAQGQPAQSAPVDILACSAGLRQTDVPSGLGAFVAPVPGAPEGVVEIAFVNRGPQRVRSVSFVVRTPQGARAFDARGSFAPAVRIEREFTQADAVDRLTGCEVTSVAFADGTTWSR